MGDKSHCQTRSQMLIQLYAWSNYSNIAQILSWNFDNWKLEFQQQEWIVIDVGHMVYQILIIPSLRYSTQHLIYSIKCVTRVVNIVIIM